MNKKGKKANTRIKEKKSLSIAHYGDFVVIKNRSTLAASLSGFLMLVLCIVGGIALKDAWKMPMFAVMFLIIIAAIIYSFVSIVFSKVTLDSINMQMNVYSPFKKQYKFEDVNYVEIKSSKPKDGVILHRVITYIGNGKKNVELTTMSLKQAEELASLLRGMLDNAAMIYPEGNEEPFDFDDAKETKQGVVSFGFKRNKKDKSKEEDSSAANEENLNNKEKSLSDGKSDNDEKPSLSGSDKDESNQESLVNDSHFERNENKRETDSADSDNK